MHAAIIHAGQYQAPGWYCPCSRGPAACYAAICYREHMAYVPCRRSAPWHAWLRNLGARSAHADPADPQRCVKCAGICCRRMLTTHDRCDIICDTASSTVTLIDHSCMAQLGRRINIGSPLCTHVVAPTSLHTIVCKHMRMPCTGGAHSQATCRIDCGGAPRMPHES